MKKLLLTMFILVLLAVPVMADDWFDSSKEYCLQEGDYDHCLSFAIQPWGPGLNWSVYLHSYDITQVVGPIKSIVTPLDNANQRKTGEIITFRDVGFTGVAKDGELHLFQSYLIFKRVK